MALARRVPATLSDEIAQRAAVAVVLAAGDHPALLLVKRRERVGDPWSGHVAMPGGFSRNEPAPVAAIRETMEETGLDIARNGEQLGYLDDVYPRSVHLPRVIVTPVVFVVPQLFPVAASVEVERALWVPVDELRDPSNRDLMELERGGVRVQFPCINVHGLTIWGLTERMITQLLTISA